MRDLGDSLGQVPQEIGNALHAFMARLYPICRSITGNGVRETLDMITEHIPLTISEVRSGTMVFDWTVPLEWNISDAYIKNQKGERVVDFKENNLHVVGYSTPVRGHMSLAELKPHLFTLPDHPEWIPYRTSYYKDNWGFCLTHNQYSRLRDETYEVVIESSLSDGHLSYAECYLEGKTTDEVLISCHVCHPSLCNDNLSGIAVATFLAKELSRWDRRLSYRFLFIPATIGAIAWLALNERQTDRIKHGLVITGVGDEGRITYKKSRRGDSDIDRVFQHVLKHSGSDFRVIDFFPYGYDERQYCSPGFDLPVGCFMRTRHGEYPEYHSSADNLDFVKAGALADSFTRCKSVFEVLENNLAYLNQSPKCEPQLGRRGLYRAIAGQQEKQSRELTLLWVLNGADGRNTLLDIADRAGIPFSQIYAAAMELVEVGLLKELGGLGSRKE
jgi:aminopeptidase-like protein